MGFTPWLRALLGETSSEQDESKLLRVGFRLNDLNASLNNFDFLNGCGLVRAKVGVNMGTSVATNLGAKGKITAAGTCNY